MLLKIAEMPMWAKIGLLIAFGYVVWLGTGILAVGMSCGWLFKAIWDSRGESSYDSGTSSSESGVDLVGLIELLMPWKWHEVAGACSLLNAFMSGG